MNKQTFIPEPKLIQKYAEVMVNYALGNGRGLKPGETVFLVGQECTKPLFIAIRNEIYRQGGNVLTRYLPDDTYRYGLNRSLIELGTEEQLKHFASNHWQGIASDTQHILFILSEPDIHSMKGLDAKRVGMLSTAASPFMDMRAKQERMGKQTWTLCYYPTESIATEAGTDVETYWKRIVNACHLEDENPVQTWKNLQEKIGRLTQKLNALHIESVHVVGEDVNLHILLGEYRKWLGATGQNIPSYEVYISPDWRGTEGWMRINQPLYYSGTKISGIYLRFEGGIVVEASANENEPLLLEMLAKPNANKVGEFSLTDGDDSAITEFMACTLYDENRGGKYGNTHIAVGNSYRNSFSGDIQAPTETAWEEMGFNHCSQVHTDMVSTSNRTVTATLKDGSKKIIYKDGHFTLD